MITFPSCFGHYPFKGDSDAHKNCATCSSQMYHDCRQKTRQKAIQPEGSFIKMCPLINSQCMTVGCGVWNGYQCGFIQFEQVRTVQV